MSVAGVFFMAIPMVAHCVLMFLPVLTGTSLSLFPNAGAATGKISPFVRFVFTANFRLVLNFLFCFVGRVIPGTQVVEMFITHDNIWRLAMAVLLFAVLFPFSMSNYGRRKWFGPTMLLHVICATLFTIDQIRRGAWVLLLWFWFS